MNIRSNQYSKDCLHYSDDNQRLRPYCEVVEREIRPKDCRDCGWYILRREEREHRNIGTVTEEDIKRVLGEKRR